MFNILYKLFRKELKMISVVVFTCNFQTYTYNMYIDSYEQILHYCIFFFFFVPFHVILKSDRTTRVLLALGNRLCVVLSFIIIPIIILSDTEIR